MYGPSETSQFCFPSGPYIKCIVITPNSSIITSFASKIFTWSARGSEGSLSCLPCCYSLLAYTGQERFSSIIDWSMDIFIHHHVYLFIHSLIHIRTSCSQIYSMLYNSEFILANRAIVRRNVIVNSRVFLTRAPGSGDWATPSLCDFR